MATKKTERPMPLGHPGQFPIGSPESRAAARAMADAMKPTPDEQDCLTLCRSSHLFGANWDKLTSTQAFSRGRELWEKRNPGKPFYDGPEEMEAYLAEEPKHLLMELHLMFSLAHGGRDPQPGDVFTFEQFNAAMEAFAQAHEERVRQAWQRQVPGQPFPKTIARSHRFAWEEAEELATGKKSCSNQAEHDKWQPLVLTFTENGLAVAPTN